MDLPFPVSANELWTVIKDNGKGVIGRSRRYRAWRDKAHMAVIANGCWRKRVAMPAHFTAAILLSRDHRARGDVDNRIKPVLDWAQSVELVKNDSLCEGVTARWVEPAEAPHGARLILRSIS